MARFLNVGGWTLKLGEHHFKVQLSSTLEHQFKIYWLQASVFIDCLARST